MILKAVNGSGSEKLLTCSHIIKSHIVDDNRVETGIEIEAMPGGEILRLPGDADVVYVLNDQGKTVQIYRWPPPAKSGVAR